jgi:hypothetical protein
MTPAGMLVLLLHLQGMLLAAPWSRSEPSWLHTANTVACMSHCTVRQAPFFKRVSLLS